MSTTESTIWRDDSFYFKQNNYSRASDRDLEVTQDLLKCFDEEPNKIKDILNGKMIFYKTMAARLSSDQGSKEGYIADINNALNDKKTILFQARLFDTWKKENYSFTITVGTTTDAPEKMYENYKDKKFDIYDKDAKSIGTFDLRWMVHSEAQRILDLEERSKKVWKDPKISIDSSKLNLEQWEKNLHFSHQITSSKEIADQLLGCLSTEPNQLIKILMGDEVYFSRNYGIIQTWPKKQHTVEIIEAIDAAVKSDKSIFCSFMIPPNRGHIGASQEFALIFFTDKECKNKIGDEIYVNFTYSSQKGAKGL